MAHRLNHLHKKQVQYVQQTSMTSNQKDPVGQTNPYGATFKKAQQSSSKMPRPIFVPCDKFRTYEKNSFRKGESTFPSPQQLFYSDNNYDAGPHFIRPSFIVLHSQPKKTLLPLGAWITPFGSSNSIPSVSVHSPLRCHRCKAYINPYFQLDGSRKYCTCNICGMKFQIEQSIDKKNLQATEISTKGVIDFVVKDKFYYRKRTDLIKIVICLELSQPMIQLGIFGTVIQSIKSAVENSQFQDKIKISVVYFSQEGVVFPKLKKTQDWNQHQPTEYIVKVSENCTFCCPLSDSQSLLDANKDKQKIIYLLDKINQKAEQYYQKGKYQNNANYVAAIKCLKQSFDTQTGRIMLFSSLDPRSGKCSIRARTQQQNKLPLKPINHQFYQLSKQLLKLRIGVQHYIFTKDNMICHQLATTHYLSSQTGGPLHFYPGYSHQNHSQHLYYTIYKSLTKQFVYDIDYTCRVSNGLNVSEFYVTNGVKQVRDVGLGCMDVKYSLGVAIEHEEKIQESNGAFLQFAMMYTTGNGQRKIRVINFRYLVSQKIQNLYDSIDYLAVANLMMRTYTSRLFNNQPTKVREQFMIRISNILAEYRTKYSSSQGRYSQLPVPNSMKNGLAYMHTIINSKMFMNSLKLTSDTRVAQILRINTLDFYSFSMRYYPKLYPLTMDIYQSQPLPGDFLQIQQIEQQAQQQQIAVLPQNLPLTRNSVKQNGVYLQCNGDYLIIYVMPNVDQQLLMEIFGKVDWNQIESQKLQQLQSAHNIRINIIINQLRRRNSQNSGIYLPLLVKTPLKKGPFGEMVNNLLKQDYNQCNYYSFLDAVHRLTQGVNK